MILDFVDVWCWYCWFIRCEPVVHWLLIHNNNNNNNNNTVHTVDGEKKDGQMRSDNYRTSCGGMEWENLSRELFSHRSTYSTIHYHLDLDLWRPPTTSSLEQNTTDYSSTNKSEPLDTGLGSTQLNSTQLNSTWLDLTWLDLTRLDLTWLDLTRLDLTWLVLTWLDSAQPDSLSLSLHLPRLFAGRIKLSIHKDRSTATTFVDCPIDDDDDGDGDGELYELSYY